MDMTEGVEKGEGERQYPYRGCFRISALKHGSSNPGVYVYVLVSQKKGFRNGERTSEYVAAVFFKRPGFFARNARLAEMDIPHSCLKRGPFDGPRGADDNRFSPSVHPIQ